MKTMTTLAAIAVLIAGVSIAAARKHRAVRRRRARRRATWTTVPLMTPTKARSGDEAAARDRPCRSRQAPRYNGRAEGTEARRPPTPHEEYEGYMILPG